MSGKPHPRRRRASAILPTWRTCRTPCGGRFQPARGPHFAPYYRVLKRLFHIPRRAVSEFCRYRIQVRRPASREAPPFCRLELRYGAVVAQLQPHCLQPRGGRFEKSLRKAPSKVPSIRKVPSKSPFESPRARPAPPPPEPPRRPRRSGVAGCRPRPPTPSARRMATAAAETHVDCFAFFGLGLSSTVRAFLLQSALCPNSQLSQS